MRLRKIIATACYGVNAAACLLIGLAFVFSQEFFGFHSDVIQTAWQDLDAAQRTLYLGMMRTEGAGYLATFTAFAFLLALPFRRGEKWAYWALTTIGIAEHLPTCLATFHVSKITPASPPWEMSLALLVLLLAGLFFSLKHNDV